MPKLLLPLVLVSALLPRGFVYAQAVGSEAPPTMPPSVREGPDSAAPPAAPSMAAPAGVEAAEEAAPTAPEIVALPNELQVAPQQASEAAISAPSLAAFKQWTRQLLTVEDRTRELKAERARIRTTGYRIGRAVSWGLTGVLAFGALSAFGSAQLVEQALSDDDTDVDLHDTDGDGDVDRGDERHSRRIARGLALSSLVPIGVGVFTTVMLRKRSRERARLTRDIEDLDEKRGAILERMRAVVELDAHQAAVDVRITF